MNLTDLPDDPPKRWRLLPEREVVKRILNLGSWVMFAVLTQTMVNLADTLMVGRLEGPIATASQAALGLAMPLFWAVGGFFSAVGVGMQTLTARRYAAGAPLEAGRVLWTGLWVALFAGLLGGGLGYALTPDAAEFLGTASQEQQELAIVYTRMRMLGIPGMVLTFAYKAFFDGIGKTSVHLWAALVMNMANLGMNYVLIYGVPAWGIPSMEIKGAGLASMISTYFGLLLMVAVSLHRSYGNKFRIYVVSKLDGALARTILRLMVPSGSATVILMLGFLLFMKFVGDLDDQAGTGTNVYSAATKLVMDVASVCFMPLIGLGTATATAVSQSLGAGKPNLAARYGWETVRMALWIMVGIMAVMLAVPEAILRIWAPNDAQVVQVGAQGLRIISSCLPMMAVGLILAQALYGAGANVYVMTVELCLHFGVLVPLSYLLGPKLGYGMVGIWLAATLYVNLLGLAMGGKFARKGWQSIRL